MPTRRVAYEAKKFASHVRVWESAWGETCGFFTDSTALSSMQFTHYTPGHISSQGAGSNPATLQVLSIKLVKVAGGLQWPLSVYGMVAVRDVADHNRNILFSRGRSEALELTQDDPFFPLIGPSRAIVFTDLVDIEIQLKVKGGGTKASQDKALINYVSNYGGAYGPGASTLPVENSFCTLELCLQTVKRTVQATIMLVQVVKHGSWPFKYGGRVACSPLSGELMFDDSGFTHIINPSSNQIVLLDSKIEAMPDYNVFKYLSRQVVSVETEGVLDIVIQTYSKSGDIAAHGHIRFRPNYCGISQDKFALGDAEVLVTIAWPLVATSKREIVAERSIV
ncbi:uncharacterized protein [Triticum aestivum]|uniref:uncharacterized protein n=1 Tax=Triticum aestivum TaxID=4565 RepID=UPI001D030E58|nr:uncharacterized protein LOC123129754 [Triticum aestivum]